MLKPIVVLGVLLLSVSPGLEAAPVYTKQRQAKKLHPGTVKCTLIRYKPKILVNRYNCEVYEYADGSSVVVSTKNRYSIKFPRKYARPYYVLSQEPLIINKWKDFTLQIEGLTKS